MSARDFDRALSLGRIARALELTASARPDVAGFRFARIDELILTDKRAFIQGQLVGRSALVHRLEDLHRGCRLGALSARIRSLELRAAPQVGAATFPVEVTDHDGHVQGALLEIVVGAEVRSTTAVSEQFKAAVERARDFPASVVSPERGAEIRRAPWAVVPELPAGFHVDEESAGLAALIAFGSWAGRMTIVHHRVFSARIDGQGNLHPVGGMEAKDEVVKEERPSVKLATAEPRTGALDFVKDQLPRSADLLFGTSVRVAVSDPASPDEVEMARRIEALLAVSRGPLPVSAIVEALTSRMWLSQTSFDRGLRVEEVLGGLVTSGTAVEVEPGDEPLEDLFRLADGAVQRQWRAAETAEDAVRQKPALESLLEMSQRWPGLRKARPYCLAALDRPDGEVANDFVALVEGDDSAAIQDGIFVLERIALHLGAAKVDTLVAELGRRDNPACMALVVAHHVGRLPWLEHAVTPLKRCGTWIDRLLWLQAVAEALLQTWTGVAWAFGSAGGKPPAIEGISERPSIGRLAEVVGWFASEKWPEPGAKLATSLLALKEAKCPLHETLMRGWNAALHQPGIWLRFTASRQSETRALALFGKQASTVRGLLAASAGLDLALGSQGRVTLAGHDLDLAPAVVHADGQLCFYRGVSGERVRYWDFVDGRRWFTALPEAGPGTVFERMAATAATRIASEASPAPARSRSEIGAPTVPIGSIPQPLAEVRIELRRAVRLGEPAAILAATDLGVQLLLRLSWFTVVAAASTDGVVPSGTAPQRGAPNEPTDPNPGSKWTGFTAEEIQMIQTDVVDHDPAAIRCPVA